MIGIWTKSVFKCRLSRQLVNGKNVRLKLFKRLHESAFNFDPEFDHYYYSDPAFTKEIENNIKNRKGVGDISKVMKLYSQINSADNKDKELVRVELLKELMKIPNKSHPDVAHYGSEPKVVDVVGNKKEFAFRAKELDQLAEPFEGLHKKRIGLFAGTKAYYLQGFLSSLEDALVKFTLDFLLKKKNFVLVSVPDLLPTELITRCGMIVDGERNQIYRLNSCHYDDISLSGTSEMSLAGIFANKCIEKDLPIKLTAVSRCYRAETANTVEEKGIYRVNQFTKVEMFGLTKGDIDHSESLLEEFVSIQKELFSSLHLHFHVLDMPLHELGAPAYRKFDIEAWMPGRQAFGEISSASNCSDFQSRRLGIRYSAREKDSKIYNFAHTVNGTACAIPRMLIALLETHQNEDGNVNIPDVLKPFLPDAITNFQNVEKINMKLIKEFPSIET